ncbi:MAG: Xaa-Pro dipeptidase [Gammaproteobacteria bacterium]|jgi:Xaa-Pro dipeptidase
MSPDQAILNETWSDLSQFRELPNINVERLRQYRFDRIREQLRLNDAAMCVLISPISLRYAVDYRNYALFQSHIPSTYLFISQDGPTILHGAYGTEMSDHVDSVTEGRALSFFDGGQSLTAGSELVADDIKNYLADLGADNRRVAVEYVNPSLTQALEKNGLDVIDGVLVSETARLIKSDDEIDCMRWSVAVAEHGIAKMKAVLKPGVSELQLWGIINYANLANNGDWHDGRMLASGPRINPWLQEASPRKVEAGDLVGLDTDMVGPYGYCADVSRTFFCGPGSPNKRQKELYQAANAEVEFNLTLLKPGISFSDFRAQAYDQDEQYHVNAYTCIIHGVGMCDEYPRIDQKFAGPLRYEDEIQKGMVICVESYVGAVGERDGVKLEQQVVITETGYELLTTSPYESAFE